MLSTIVSFLKSMTLAWSPLRLPEITTVTYMYEKYYSRTLGAVCTNSCKTYTEKERCYERKNIPMYHM